MKSKNKLQSLTILGKEKRNYSLLYGTAVFSAETFPMRKSLRCGRNPPPEVWMILKTRHSMMWNV